MAFALYVSDYYNADADEYISSTDTALIFYPGAKVEYTSYVPITMSLAENGVDCLLVEMPFNMALFGMNRQAK